MMFTGRNELRLNQATMKMAVQEFLDKRTVGVKTCVMNIIYLANNDKPFVIVLDDSTAEAKAKGK